MAACRKIQLAHYYFFALVEFQGAGDFADGVGGAVNDGDFFGLGADEIRERFADGFVFFHPDAPGDSVGVPEAHEFVQAIFYIVGERAFGATAEVNLALEDWKMRANFYDICVCEHNEEYSFCGLPGTTSISLG